MKNINILLVFSFLSLPVFSQYTQTEIDAFLNEATGTNSVGTEIIGNARYFYTNNYPNHDIGQKNGNITPIASASTWAMCAYPRLGGSVTQLYSSTEANGSGCTGTYNFGVALNGIKFGPSSATFFEDGSGLEVQDWHYEALYFETLDGDGNNDNIYGAHSTGAGLYHYHGDPVGYFAETVANGGLGIDGSAHSPIVGYAADGYPIYYKYGYANIDGTGGIVTLESGYQLKSGSRSGDGTSAPNGTYDGEYVEDYEFTVTTKLDECNGRFGITPDFPKGTYYYVITANWPVIPRCFAGSTLDNSFLIGPSASCGDSNSAADCSSEVATSNSHTWTGETNTDWDTVTNWVDDSVPSTSGYASIPDVSGESGNFPVIANNTEVVDVIVYPSATLNVNSGKSLTITSDLTNQGSVSINSDATSSGSLLISGESSGNITYNRYLTSSATSGEGWYLISSPVEDETENDIITNGNLLTNGSSQYSISTYNNSLSASTGWSYLTASANGSLDSGRGYSIKRDGSGTIPFSGSYKTTNLKDYSISVGTHSSWNLIGNPYPSFISANDDTSTTADFLTLNSSELDPSFAALYVWNSSTKSYDEINHALGTAAYVAPGQAFFVYSKSGGGDVSIRETMQSYQSGNLFLKNNSSTIPEITLSISDVDSEKSTKFKYIDGTTTGLDVGYDAGLFSGVSSNFNIYSHLLSNSEGVDFGLQCLPPENYNQMVIPIGVNAESNKEISFSISKLNVPAEIKIYLEDRLNNTFTGFDDENSSYKITVNESLNGIGRFYLHTNNSSLSAYENISLENVSVYKVDNNKLRIVGLTQGDNSIKLFTLIGKQLVNLSFTSNGVKDILLPKLNPGVYIIQLQSDLGKINKKIILE
jgi:hypothetical protein